MAFVGLWWDTCRASEDTTRPAWPAHEATELVAAVLAAVTSSTDDGVRRGLDAAARSFARATASTPVLVARLGALRQVLAPRCAPALQPRLASVLDSVVMLCTQAALTELEGAALTDSLTGAGNRRALETAAKVALASSARSGQPLSLAVIDLDGLKVLNDTEGHGAGDRALAGVANALRQNLRDTDQLFRIGGDEFVVLLPLAPADTVGMLMSRAVPAAPRFSWGSATTPNDGTGLEELLAVADARLYAKRRDAGYRRGVVPMASSTAAQAGGLRALAATPRRHLLRSALVAAASVLAVLGLVLGTGLATGGAHRTGNSPGSGGVPSHSSGPNGSTPTSGGSRSGSHGGSSSQPPAGTTPPGGSAPGAPSGSSSGPGPGGGSGTGPGPTPPPTVPGSVPTTVPTTVPTVTIPVTIPVVTVPVTVPTVTVPTLPTP